MIESKGLSPRDYDGCGGEGVFVMWRHSILLLYLFCCQIWITALFLRQRTESQVRKEVHKQVDAVKVVLPGKSGLNRCPQWQDATYNLSHCWWIISYWYSSALFTFLIALNLSWTRNVIQQRESDWNI